MASKEIDFEIIHDFFKAMDCLAGNAVWGIGMPGHDETGRAGNLAGAEKYGMPVFEMEDWLSSIRDLMETHKKWLEGAPRGERANFSRIDFRKLLDYRGDVFAGADLRTADFQDADVRHADFRHSNRLARISEKLILTAPGLP